MESTWSVMLRIHLSGQVIVEGADGDAMGSAFPGRQGREAFALLVMRRGRPVSRDEFVEALWGRTPPEAAGGALSSIVSKLRRLLSVVGVDGASALTSSSGSYELRLPQDAWVDHEVAFSSIHEAETELSAGRYRAAYGPSAVARQIAERPFLPGSEASWIEDRRIKLRQALVRALECRSAVYLWNGEHAFAVETAQEAVGLEPFRESAYRLLMRAHAAAGNGAEALRVYERCRSLIADELGVAPSPATKALKNEIIAAR